MRQVEQVIFCSQVFYVEKFRDGSYKENPIAATFKALGLRRATRASLTATGRARKSPPELFPNDGKLLGEVRTATVAEYERACNAPLMLSKVADDPSAPARRSHPSAWQRTREAKTELGMLVTLEAGKIIAEGRGEVREMIDICDFATGLAPALRPDHRQRAPESSHDGAMAAARRRRRHHRLQLPPSPCGHGTAHWRRSAAIQPFGNPPVSHHSPPSPRSRLPRRFAARTMLIPPSSH